MMRKSISIILILLLVAGLMSACSNSREASGKANPELLGHWYQKDGSAELDFSSDGAFEGTQIESTGLEGLALADRYQAGETQIVFSDISDNHVSVDYSIVNGELTLSALGKSCVFVRTAPISDEPVPYTQAPTEPSEEQTTEAPTTQSLQETIIGTWSAPYQGYTLTYSFAADGSGYASLSGLTVPISYTIEGDVITVTGYAFGSSDTGSAIFEIIDGALYCTKDGETLVFTRDA